MADNEQNRETPTGGSNDANGNGANGKNGTGGLPPKLKVPRPPTASQPAVSSKSDTSRVDLKDAAAASKKETSRIELPEVSPATADGKAMEAAKKATLRVEVEQEESKPAASDKKATSRIDVDAALEGQAVKAATPVAEPEEEETQPEPFAGAPKTIRLKRPGAQGAVTLPKPAPKPAGADAETIEGKKSETSRIELPPEAADDHPPTRRKTVRIKRPDGTAASRQLTIARPTEPGEEAALPTTISGRRAEQTEDVGAVFAVVALAAVLLAAVLVYVLAAQTVAPGLPFPGKIL